MNSKPLRAAALLASLALSGCSEPPPANPLLIAPVTLLDAATDAGARNLYLVPSAHWALTSVGIEGIPAISNERLAAVANPAAWRKLHREKRFDGVVLSSSQAESGPLIAHLLESPDFQIAKIDHSGILFLSGSETLDPDPRPGMLETSFPSETERGEAFSQLALVFASLDRLTDANRAINSAIELTPDSATVRAREAALMIHLKRWSDAIDAANHSLKINPKNVNALRMKTQALMESGRADSAWHSALQLRQIAGENDMETLFFFAQIANRVKATTHETAALERLVSLAETESLPSASYRVLLAQALARQGYARQAASQLETALTLPDLPETERTNLIEALAAIRTQIRPDSP